MLRIIPMILPFRLNIDGPAMNIPKEIMLKAMG